MRKLIDGHKKIAQYISSKSKEEESALKKEHKASLKTIEQDSDSKLEAKKTELQTIYDRKLNEKYAQIKSNHELKKKALFLDAQTEVINYCHDLLRKEFEKNFDSKKVQKIIDNLKKQVLNSGDEIKEIQVPKTVKLKTAKSVLDKLEIIIVTKQGTIYKESFDTIIEENNLKIESIINQDLLKNL